MRLLSTVLIALSAASLAPASELPAPLAGEVRYLSGFDAAARTGLFQEVGEAGEVRVLDRRPGWTLQEIHPVPLGATRGVLLIWKSFPRQDLTSPELWADGEVIQGFEELPTLNRVWPAGDAPVVWHGARHELRVRDGEASLVVGRDLKGENDAVPVLRKRERFALRAGGVRLQKAKYGPVRTPEQRLNAIADLVDSGRFEKLPGALEALVGTGEEYVHRGAVLATRVPMDAGGWRRSKRMLDAIVTADGPAAERAAARLFEMVQAEWEAGAE